MGKQVAAGFLWGCSSVGRAPALQAGGQEFESLHLHSPKRKPRRRAETYALREQSSLSRMQARYKIKYFDLLTNASISRKSNHLILHTYLENRILKNYDKSFKRNIKDIRGASKDAKETSQDVNTKPTRGATLCTFDGIRTRGGNQLVKLIRAQGGCLGTKSR